jgi:biopolymer transport protein ExbD
MRKHLSSLKLEEDENEINLTPMLDVVFIMLIFFIVTSTFIRAKGIKAQRPDQNQQQTVVQNKKGAILVIVDNANRIWIDGLVVDPRAVRPNIERLHAEDATRPLVVQVDSMSNTDTLVNVMDAARQANISNISIVAGDS